MSSKFKTYSPEDLEHLFSNYLISSLSYSKVNSFARHEKAFEMNYIFGIYSRSSATTIAGQAYHHALQYFFETLKSGEQLDLVDVEKSAFEYIDEVKANYWKIQKTTPTIEICQLKAIATVKALLKNFISEQSTYTDNIKNILDVEVYCDEFLTINGVDIPLPWHSKIDLVVQTIDGKIVIIDHKSKNAFTSDDEIALSIGVQAMAYVKCYEAKTGLTVDEVWFVENKYSQNKDLSPQLILSKIVLDNSTRAIYEALLYEPVKRTLDAVSNPDYIFLINTTDKFVDMPELYDFWIRTMTCEIDDFNVDECKKPIVAKRLKKIRDASSNAISPQVIKKFKETADTFITYDLSTKNMNGSQKIEHIIRSFGSIVEVAHVFDGYSCDCYLLKVSAGVAINSLYNKRLDIASALDVENVRMTSTLIKYDSKSYLGIEVPKKRTKDLFYDVKYLEGLKIPIGIDNFGELIFWDFENHSTPHTLMCGGTGSGKSVCINSIIKYVQAAKIKDIIIFDPKYEFTHMKSSNVDVIQEIGDIETYMALLVQQMNDMVKLGRKQMTFVVFDEFADAILNSRKGKNLDKGEKSLEENLQILLQKGRSSGFRILAAMQRASVKVINGDAKANFPVQICFRVPKELDSKVVLDEGGAEALQGYGDGLMKSPETLNNAKRFQAFL